jgi:hypothetical protein
LYSFAIEIPPLTLFKLQDTDMPKKVPIGVSNFRKLLEFHYLFVDKTLFIQDFIEDSAETLLFTAPPRWGKTLRLSMLQHFFASNVNGVATAGLFDDLLIAKAADGKYIREHQGQYPVILISLIEAKENSIDEFYASMAKIISKVCTAHYELVHSDKLYDFQKDTFRRYVQKTATKNELKDFLLFLSECLFQHYGKRVIILIDEYDAPVNETPEERRVEVVQFLARFYSAALKDNSALAKGIMTGVYRLAKANIFSGLNNLKECTMLDDRYNSAFGFTEQEVVDLFTVTGLAHNIQAVRSWFNGYNKGGVTLYNPWSIVNCLDNQGVLQAYWVEVAHNTLIHEGIGKADITVFQGLEKLLQGESVVVDINKFISFEDLQRDPTAVWSLLFHGGYLTLVNIESIADPLSYQCRVRLPNLEVKSLYVRYLKWWSSKFTDSKERYNHFITNLLMGNVEVFTDDLQRLLFDSFSYFDTGGDNPERVYHAFVIGLVADLHKTYVIRSNRESGRGRYDVLLVPKHKQGLGIIMEFKSIDRKSTDEQQLQAAEAALVQMKDKGYVSELRQYEITEHYMYVAIAFAGKQVTVLHEKHIGADFDAQHQVKVYVDSQTTSPSSSPTRLSSSASAEKAASSLKKDSLAAVFGDVVSISRQAVGQCEGKDIVFDIFKTKGDGSCGYYSLPIPYDRAGVVDLLMSNLTNARIRALIAVEIIEGLKSNHLPASFYADFQQFHEFKGYQIETDIAQAELLQQVLDHIDPSRTQISDRQFELVIVYLQQKAERTPDENSCLEQLLRFQQEHQIKLNEFKAFCQSEIVVATFIQEYIGKHGELSFTVGEINFGREASFLDAILECSQPPIRLIIWEDDPEDATRIKIVYQGGLAAGSVNHVYHRSGRDTHFELMAETTQPLLTSLPLPQPFVLPAATSAEAAVRTPTTTAKRKLETPKTSDSKQQKQDDKKLAQACVDQGIFTPPPSLSSAETQPITGQGMHIDSPSPP